MGEANSYLINTDDNFILIDAGSEGKTKNIKETLSKYNADLADIDLIIITHVHQDHVGSLAELKSASGAKILAHRAGQKLLEKGKTDFPAGTNWFFGLISQFISNFLSTFGEFEPVKPDIVVEEEFILDEFGIDGKVISTPGHTRDSLSVIIENKHCFCGDTLFNMFPHTVYPIFANDEKTLLQSWQKLKVYDCDFYYPGHGRKFGGEKFIQTYKKYMK